MGEVMAVPMRITITAIVIDASEDGVEVFVGPSSGIDLGDMFGVAQQLIAERRGLA